MKTVQPKISVIIPIFNTANYLDRCITSVINQSYTNLEIILVDDGSEDNSHGMCILYQEKDSRIRVLRQKNMGLSAARNAGLNIATGEYVSFVDSDDFLDANTYATLIACLAGRKDIDIVIFGYRRIRNGKVILEYRDRYRTPDKIDIIEELFEDFPITNAVWNKLYRADALHPWKSV